MAKMFTYGRASTDKQQITLKVQEEVCRRYYEMRCALGEEWEWGGWFPDAAITSTINWFQRPMGEKIFNMARAGDVIVVSNFDRAIRGTIDCCETIRIVNEKNVGLIVLDHNLDTQSPMGRAVAKIFASIAECERESIARRTRDAIQLNLRTGKKHSQGCPIGWKGGPQRTMVPDIEDRRWAKEIVRLRDDKRMSFRMIFQRFAAARLRIWNKEPWHPRRVRNAYVAAKCGFPRVYAFHLPSVTQLMHYMDLHDGRPPLLEHGAVRRGLLHTLQPMPDPPPGISAPAAS